MTRRCFVRNMAMFLIMVIFTLQLTTGILATTVSSPEHRIRQKLLKNHDKRVRPISDSKRPVIVTLGIKLGKLVKVDNKAQTVTTKVWIFQKWKDPNLSWKKAKYDNIRYIYMSPSEIWVPDIVLYNNADESISNAGGVTKFKTSVTLYNSGVCEWRSPATFISTCKINVQYWPFDQQTCSLTFGSQTHTRKKLVIRKKTLLSRTADDFVTNGDWDIVSLNITRNEHLYSCCDDAFSDVTLVMVLQRKSVYYVLYLIAPCCIITALALLSFYIPSESGERIGFVTTLLLAMSVFLLIVGKSLPETSDSVPLLGIFVSMTLAEIALVLCATIFVLRCYHSDGAPSVFMQKIVRFFCCQTSLPKKPRVIRETTVKPEGSETEMKPKPTSAQCNNSENAWQEVANDNSKITCQEVANKLDKIFFGAAVLSTAILYAVIYAQIES